ncbi:MULTISPECIES: hypothetical protein [Brenneria]|uniref:hypothetical protein n=1 Tax=Brenneria TaxID=71655 RepID=UPI001447C042|nr:hypothetical protein [Brenneria roseae]
MNKQGDILFHITLLATTLFVVKSWSPGSIATFDSVLFGERHAANPSGLAASF